MRKKSKFSLFTHSLVLLLFLSIQLFSSTTVMAQSGDLYNPTAYELFGRTCHISGQLTDIQFNDGNYIIFESYYTGTNTIKFADNNISDVDSSASIGTHYNFSAQQHGPDSILDTLIEENTGGASNTTLVDSESFEGAWPPIGWTESDRWNNESDQTYDGIYSADYDGPGFGTSSGNLDTPGLDCSNADAIYIDFWYRDDDCDSNDFLIQYYNGSSWNLISDLGATFQEDQWLHYQEKIIDNQYFVSAFRVRWRVETVEFGENIWVDLVTINKEVETENYELDLEIQWTNANYSETNEELAIYADIGRNSQSLNTSNGYMIVSDGTPDWGSTAGTISFWIFWDTIGNRPWGQHDNMETRLSGSNLVVDWGYADSLVSNTSFISARWYFVAIVWNENNDELGLYIGDQENSPTLDAYSSNWTSAVSTVGVIENNFMASRGGVGPTDGIGDDLRYWSVSRNLTELQHDYNTELNGSETSLAAYFKLNGNFNDTGPNSNNGAGLGTYSFSSEVPFDKAPSEKIQVDVWHDSSWQNLFTDLKIAWNNISISPYLNSPTFTIRFKGEIEAADNDQDQWHIDLTLLHVWSNQYSAEVEFSGSSSQEDISELTWTIVSGWTIDSVNVTLQLYNYSLGSYSLNGNGWYSYISSSAPDDDEIKNQMITIDPTDFRNATGHWKIMIKGVKTTDSQFNLKVNLVSYEVMYTVLPDVVVQAVTASHKTAYSGDIVVINVTISNEGGATITFNVTAYYNNTQIGRKLVLDLTKGANTTLEFVWNTANVTPGSYIITASTNAILGEVNTTNNTFVNGILEIRASSPPLPFDWTIALFLALLVIGALLPLTIRLRNSGKSAKSTPNIYASDNQSIMHPLEITGKKTLLIMDQTPYFHRALIDFIRKTIAKESVHIFTSRNSLLHTAFSKENVKFYLLSPQLSSLKRISMKKVLVPMRDLSVLLDVITKTWKKGIRKPRTIIFDNLSDTILMCGFAKTYKFMRFLLEDKSSPRATALFVFNPTAHDSATSSSIKGLFQFQLANFRIKPKDQL